MVHAAVGGHVGAHDPCYSHGPCWNPWSTLLLQAVLVPMPTASGGHVSGCDVHMLPMYTVLMSLVHVAAEGRISVRGLCRSLRPW